jgi:CCR4-NOT transcription complex subunit 10
MTQGKSPFEDESDTPASNGAANQGLQHTRRWFPNNASTAKVVVQYNLTVAYAFRGELEKAGEALKQLSKFKEPNTEIPIQAMLLALYIQVQMGHTDIARKIIKQHCPQYR